MSALPTLSRTLLRAAPPYVVVDTLAHIDVSTPQIAGETAFNAQVRTTTDALVATFRRRVKKDDRAHPTRYHTLRVGWQLLGRSRGTTGVQLWVYQQHGLVTTTDRVPLWFDTAAQRPVTLPRLFLAPAWPEVSRSVTDTLTGRGYRSKRVKAALAGPAAPAGKGPSFGFSTGGSLMLTFAAGVLSDAPGPVSVRLAAQPLAPRLSPAGRTAAASAHGARSAPVPAMSPRCAKRKCLALTFDDGPGPYTAELVALLQQEKVPATFFLVGDRVAQTPDLVALEQAGGMEIGNHSSHHDQLTFFGPQTMTRDLQHTSTAIAAVTGKKPTLLRPPYGARNSRVDAVSKSLGMAEILWNVDTLDWLHRDSRRVTKDALGPARNGSIILMHDIHRTTVGAVAGVIAGLRARGFTLVTVTELLGNRPPPGRVYSHRHSGGR